MFEKGTLISLLQLMVGVGVSLFKSGSGLIN